MSSTDNWQSLGKTADLKLQYSSLKADGKIAKGVTFNQWVAAEVVKQAIVRNADKKPAPKAKPVVTSKKETTTKPTAKKASVVKPTTSKTETLAPKKAQKPTKATKAPEQIAPDPDAEFLSDNLDVLTDDAKALGMTIRQQKFCHYYVQHNNSTRAALDAGFTTNRAAAGVIGHRLLKNDKVSTHIANITRQQVREVDISAKRILQEYANMAFANLEDFITIGEDGLPVVNMGVVSREQISGLSSIEVTQMPALYEDGPQPLKVKIKLADKKAALDMLAKRAGLLKEEIDINHNIKGLDTNQLAIRMAFLLRKAKETPSEAKT